MWIPRARPRGRGAQDHSVLIDKGEAARARPPMTLDSVACGGADQEGRTPELTAKQKEQAPSDSYLPRRSRRLTPARGSSEIPLPSDASRDRSASDSSRWKFRR